MTIIGRASRTLREEGVREFIRTADLYIRRYIYWRYLSLHYKNRCDFDANKVARVELDPNQIRSTVRKVRERVPRSGDDALVGELAGRWDTIRKPMKELRFHEEYTEALASGRETGLLRSIKEDGYKLQHELADGKTREIGGVVVPDEPLLAVGRDNEPLRWSGGRHRITAAQLLDVESVHAYVVIWHPKADRERFIEKYGVDEPKREDHIRGQPPSPEA